MNSFNEIKTKIIQSDNIVITSHVNPDGDAIGSGLALYLALKSINKKVNFLLQDSIPDTTKFLKHSSEIKKYDLNQEIDFKLIDLVIFVDSASRNRVGIVDELTKKNYIINIDHHISNDFYGNLNYVEIISSTCEIMYSFLKEFGVEITLDIASALYLGMINDTGNFSHNNVTKDTMIIASKLIELGANNYEITKNFFNTNSEATLRVMGEALSNFKIFEGKVAYYYISQETIKKYKAKKENTEGIVEKLLSLEGIEISLFLREEIDGKIKGSMRSKNDIDVNKIAGIFGGGGHVKASGFTSDLSVEKVLELVFSKI